MSPCLQAQTNNITALPRDGGTSNSTHTNTLSASEGLNMKGGGGTAAAVVIVLLLLGGGGPMRNEKCTVQVRTRLAL